jgi:hypothetical protein
MNLFDFSLVKQSKTQPIKPRGKNSVGFHSLNIIEKKTDHSIVIIQVQFDTLRHKLMTTILETPNESLKLSGISWETYTHLLEDLSKQHRLRLTYNRGNLEIMAPSPEHEHYKKVVGRFLETLAEVLDIPIEPFGSTTFKRLGFSGAEPDECFGVSRFRSARNLAL